MRNTPARAEHSSQSSPEIGLWLWRWFWRVTLVVSLGYAWHCFYVPKNGIAWVADYPSAKQVAVQSGKPMILFFTGEWCVPCRIMKRTVWADKEVASVVEARFIPLLIDVNEPGASLEALDRYKVLATPTTIIADAEGNILEQVQGSMSQSEFLAFLGATDSQDSSRIVALDLSE
ncbi:thioredoxin family protein [Rubripirellula reticaptiva]|uniref:Thiol:disulfide interchange protein n=1 Tax=Rubripirellula reticaptiva TaxID=2528013 RepID=A0A5C6EFE9_9BACT|nr:thioredoxin family protein [Rubripirellula reticaptiva]TWU46757.1 thiol:disulfide interchange protein precursor [Rubripirellula reticaptiva]